MSAIKLEDKNLTGGMINVIWPTAIRLKNLGMSCTLTCEKWKLVHLFISISTLRAEGLFTNKIVLISSTSQFLVYGSIFMFDEILKAIKKALIKSYV